MNTILQRLPYALKIKIHNQGYFLDEKDLEELVKIDRLAAVIVRTNQGRFSCPCQNANHFMKIISDSNVDYIRDVSLVIR